MSKIVDDIDKLLLPRYLLNDVYPYPEGTQLEFKKMFHINQLSKYRETVCAFLNTNGGHIIYGILDNGLINGTSLSDNEKDKILLYIDSLHNIMKKPNGECIPIDCLKVYFEEIAKNLFIVIVSCYKRDDSTYQFLGGDSWIRMNASNMKTRYGKLYSVQDVLNLRIKLHKKHDEVIDKYKREYEKCENHTIIMVNNILLKKLETDQKLDATKKKFKINYYYIHFIWLIIATISLVKIKIIT
jgi:predicted HTH transcriptional regulator